MFKKTKNKLLQLDAFSRGRIGGCSMTFHGKTICLLAKRLGCYSVSASFSLALFSIISVSIHRNIGWLTKESTKWLIPPSSSTQLYV